MDLLRVPVISFPPNNTFFSYKPSFSNHNFPFPFWTYPFRLIPMKSYPFHAKKKNSQSEPVLEPTIIEEVSMDDEDGEDFEDEYLEDEAELYVGDGGGGGGIALAGTWWDKEALKIAEEVCQSFDGELKIYAFKTLSNSNIQVRIERLTNKSGSPSMEDIEAFSTTYRVRLDEAELAKTIPDNIPLEIMAFHIYICVCVYVYIYFSLCACCI